jgi:hypothetical protein
MSVPGFYFKVIRALDELEVPYMIVGAFAGLAFGITRVTYDIDIMVDIREEHFDAFANRFPPPRYHADPEMMRNSVRMRIMFNIIDTDEGVKADLVPLRGEPDYVTAFERRVQRTFIDDDDHEFQAWCARPEDIMIGKLQAWVEGESSKHPADIYNILVFLLSGLDQSPFDLRIVDRAASRIGSPALRLWRELVKRAENEVMRRKGDTR